MKELAQLDQLVKQLGTPSDSVTLRATIGDLKANQTKLAREIVEDLQPMSESSDEETRRQYEKLVQTFRTAVEQFQKVVSLANDAERRYPLPNSAQGTPSVPKSGGTLTGSGMLPEDYNARSTSSGTTYGGQQDQMFDPSRLVTYDDHDTALIEERNKEIREIAQDMAALQEMFQDVNIKVEEQAPQLEQAEVQVHQAQETVVAATHEVAKAGKLKKGKYMFKGGAGGAAAGALAGAAAGTVVLGPIGTLAGAVVGTAIGGIFGGAAGKKVAQKQQSQMDQELFYHDLNTRWQPDEEATHCRACGKGFKTTRRRHHCRKCGFVYCSKCSNFKTKVQSDSIAFDHEVRVCQSCFYGKPPPPPATIKQKQPSQTPQQATQQAPQAYVPAGSYNGNQNYNNHGYDNYNNGNNYNGNYDNSYGNGNNNYYGDGNGQQYQYDQQQYQYDQYSSSSQQHWQQSDYSSSQQQYQGGY